VRMNTGSRSNLPSFPTAEPRSPVVQREGYSLDDVLINQDILFGIDPYFPTPTFHVLSSTKRQVRHQHFYIAYAMMCAGLGIFVMWENPAMLR